MVNQIVEQNSIQDGNLVQESRTNLYYNYYADRVVLGYRFELFGSKSAI